MSCGHGTSLERMVERWTHVLFDMDGTLLNSGEPIMSRIARTVSHFGGSVPSDAELRLMLGPTTPEVLEKYLPPDVVEEATAFYRELAHREAMSGFSLFDGVAELLPDLNNAGAFAFSVSDSVKALRKQLLG